MPCCCLPSWTIALFSRVQHKQPILPQALTSFLLSWEFVLYLHYSILGWPGWGLYARLFYFEGRDGSSFVSLSVQSSAERFAGPANVHWIILTWVGFAKSVVLIGEEKLES